MPHGSLGPCPWVRELAAGTTPGSCSSGPGCAHCTGYFLSLGPGSCGSLVLLDRAGEAPAPAGPWVWAITAEKSPVGESSHWAQHRDVPERAEAGREREGGTVMPLGRHRQVEQLPSCFLGQADVEIESKLRTEGMRPRKTALLMRWGWWWATSPSAV